MNNNPRVPILGMLVAMEIAIVGIAIYAFGGGMGTVFASGGGFHHMDYTAPPVAPIAVGDAPRIVIDDPADRVYVTTSNDRFVHVVDRHRVHGLVWGTSGRVAPLKVVRTGDGVSISRDDVPTVEFMSFNSSDRIDVQVPAGATLAIARCGGADIAGVQGGVTAHSVDGSILLADVRGTVDVRSDDGRIEARRITADAFTAHSNDGRLILDGVASPKISASTNDGRIVATLPASTDATVTARTNDGRITRDGTRLSNGDGDASNQTFTLGSGAGSISLSTDDGPITITTNGAV